MNRPIRKMMSSGPDSRIVSLRLLQAPALLLLILQLSLLPSRDACAQGDPLQIGGYVQGMPVWMKADFPPPIRGDSFLEYRVQNRFNLRWDLSSRMAFHGSLRTRLFAGDLVQEIPFYADAIDRDDGWADLSWLIAERERWILHTIPDRLYAEWNSSDWSVQIGRQRINWGINTVTNPNDLFNIYSFYDFDYPERPGSDAIRIRHFTGTLSRWEVAVSPSRDSRNSTAALLYGFNRNGYDIQLIGGLYREMIAAGGGWAGSIGQTGFKGEVMGFVELRDRPGRGNNLITTISADHMFSNSLFLTVEGVYNLSGGRNRFLLTGEILSSDNPTFSRYQFTAQASYPFSPIVNGSLATIWYPDEHSLFISPSLTWSILQDLDLNLIAQLFRGEENSVFAGAGHVMAASLRWSF